MKQINIENVSNKLLSLRKHIPQEFSRYPRKIEEIDHWKATELRQLLIYTGPFILKGNISKNQFDHFLCLHFAIRILLSKELCKTLINYSQELLLYFVKQYGLLYGVENITHNVHNLIHLCDDVKRNGPLDKFSCFANENLLQNIKKLIKSSKNPLQQIGKRLNELSNSYNDSNKSYPILREIKNNLKLPNSIINFKNYDLYQTDEYSLKPYSNKNNCVYLKDNLIIQICHIYHKEENVHFLGRKGAGVKPQYVNPASSCNVFIYIVDYFEEELQEFSIEEIEGKCFIWQNNKIYYVNFLL